VFIDKDKEIIKELTHLLRTDTQFQGINNKKSFYILLLTFIIFIFAANTAIRSGFLAQGCMFFIIAWTQYVLGVAVHEALHYGLFSKANINTFVGKVLAALLLANFNSVRRMHLKHHVTYGTNEDPDWPDYSLPNNNRNIYGLIKHALWRGFAFGDLDSKLNRSLHGDEDKSFIIWLLLMQFSMFIYFVAIGSWYDYIFFWILPGILISRTFNAVRIIAEHVGLENTATTKYEKIYMSRSTVCSGSWLSEPVANFISFILAPFNFNYHHEHHMFPQLSYQHLPKLHDVLIKMGHFEKHPEVICNSYLRTLVDLTKRRWLIRE